VTERDVRLIKAVPEVLAALGLGRIVNPPRAEQLGRDGDPDYFRLEMSATLLDSLGEPWITGRKIIEEPGDGRPRTAHIELIHADGRRWACDADALTNLRTGAAAVWTTHYLTGGVAALGLLGGGRVARWVARAADHVLRPTVIHVWSRRAETRDAFAAEMAPQLQARLAMHADPIAAGRECQAVIAACAGGEPVLTEESVPAHAPAVAVEGDPRVRQVSGELLAARPLLVDSREQAARSGSLRDCPERVWQAVTLPQVAAGRQVPAPNSVALLTGLAALDVGLAARLWLHSGEAPGESS
jgi:ornithine cyclodeaminase/alanine dehydrogenase-like protein (mu-crystallin family)